jgi:hypothetical protein
VWAEDRAVWRTAARRREIRSSSTAMWLHPSYSPHTAPTRCCALRDGAVSQPLSIALQCGFEGGACRLI